MYKQKDNMIKKQKIIIRLDSDNYLKFKKLCEDNSISMSQEIRSFIVQKNKNI